MFQFSIGYSQPHNSLNLLLRDSAAAAAATATAAAAAAAATAAYPNSKRRLVSSTGTLAAKTETVKQ